MTRTIWMTAGAVTLAAVLAVPAIAQDPQGRGAGRGQGMGMGMGPGRAGGPGGAGPMGFVRGLQLTDAQREQVRAIMQEARPAADDARKGLQLRRELNLALLADTPDQQKVESLKLALNTAHAEALARRIDVQTRVTQVLTPEQRAQARERAEQVQPGQRGERQLKGRGAVRR